MSREKAGYTDKLIREGLTPELRETTVTERVEGGVKRRYIDLGTANLGEDYHGIPLQGSPMIGRPIKMIRRRPLPRA